MSLVINADDFGKSKEVNRAVLEAFEKKFIMRTTLMVNMPFADEAVQLAQERGLSDRIGIHLNLTEGRPLTEAIRTNPFFCDGEGNFHALFHSKIMSRLYMSNQESRQIYEELKAQLEKYERYGLTLWHVDSHHHVHTDYPVYRVLKRLSAEYPLASIRISRNMYSGGNPLMRLYKKMYNNAVRKLCVHTTDFFGSYKDYADYGKTLPQQSSLEIMVHPMYDANGILVDTDIPMEEEKVTCWKENDDYENHAKPDGPGFF